MPGRCYPAIIFLHFFLLICCLSCSPDHDGAQEKTRSTNNFTIEPVNQSSILPGTDTLAIVHARIIVGDGKTIIPDGSVLINGKTITAVGNFGDIAIPDQAQVIDAGGATLLPGLIDAHFHLDRMDSLPSLVVKRGVTALRDPGAWIEAYDQERASGLPLPRLYLTGPHIDRSPPAYPMDSYVVSDPMEAQAAVHRFADQGASAIKIYFRSSPEIIRAVCEAAHSRSLPVTAHLEMTDIYSAIKSGVDGIEHITSLGSNLVPLRQAEAYKQALLQDNNARRNGRYTMWQGIDPAGEAAEQLGRFLAAEGIFLCPTLGAFEYRRTPDQIDSTRLEAFQHMLAYTKKLHDLGVNIVVGSHSSVPYAEYGWAYQHEMELLEKLGMTPLEIIHAATLQNARFFKVADQIGSIESGKVADLILVEGDPLAGIAAMRKIRRVMLAGRWMEN